MGFLRAPTPQIALPPVGAMGVEPGNTDTHVHQAPVPVVYGRARLPVVWLGDAWGIRSEPIKQKVGKSRVTTGHNYYASAAALVCAGPIHSILAIYVDGYLAWEGPVGYGPGDEQVALTVESRGLLRIYRGSWTQTADPWLAASGMTHYAYRGLCYLICEDWALGTNRPSMPNLEVVVRRLPYRPELALAPGIGTGGNPVHAALDLLLDPAYGLGLSADILDLPSWEAAAQYALNQGAQADGALQDFVSAAEAISQLLGLIGAQPVWRNGRIGLALPSEIGPSRPTLGADAWTEPPEIRLRSRAETTAAVTVRFADERLGFEPSQLRVPGPTPHQGREETFDAPWVAAQPRAWAIARARLAARHAPWLEGHVTVRRSVADALIPGDTFWLEAPYLPQDIPCRAVAITIDSPWAPEARIEFEEDRSGAIALPYIPPADPAPSPPDTEGGTPIMPEPLSIQFVTTAPPALRDSPTSHVIPVAVRGDTRTDAVQFWRQVPPGSAEIDGLITSLPIAAELNQTLSSTATSVQIRLIGQDKELAAARIEHARAMRAAALIVATNVPGEWVGWYNPIRGVNNLWIISLLRSQWGTQAPSTAKAAGTRVYLWFLPEGEPLFRWQVPEDLRPNFSQLRFKLIPSVLGHARDFESAPWLNIVSQGY